MFYEVFSLIQTYFGIFLSCSVILILIYGIYPYLNDLKYSVPPGPIPVPFIGSVLSLVSLSKAPWQVFLDMSRYYGSMFTIYIGRFRFVILNDTASIVEVLVENGNDFLGRIDRHLPGFEILGEGVINANGEKWKHLRRFGLRSMRDFGMGKEKMIRNIQVEVVHFLAELESRNGQAFFPRRLIANSIANVVCSLVFGQRFEFGDESFVELNRLLDLMSSKPLGGSFVLMVIPPLKHVIGATQAIDFKNMQNTIEEMVGECIAEHRLDYNRDEIRDFPDLFIKLQSEDADFGMDSRDFGLLMTDMFAAGTETTATAVTWTFLYLATFTNVQQKCHEIIDHVIDTNRLPESSDRSSLGYIDAVMHEALRMASPVPLGLIHTNSNKFSKAAGYDFPPFTSIMFNIIALHYDKDYWKDPEVFRPERWIAGDGKTLLKHATHFMPFGIGRRQCLGQLLARAEFYIFLTAVLHRFNLSLQSPVDITKGNFGIVNAPPEYQIRFEKR